MVSFTKVSVKNRPSNKTTLENVAIPVKLSTDCDVSVGIEKTKLLLSNPVKFTTSPAEIVTDFGYGNGVCTAILTVVRADLADFGV